MPVSYDKSREFMCSEIAKIIPKRIKNNEHISILDCGVGAGLIAKSLYESLGDKYSQNIALYGLEIFKPYIEDPKQYFAPNYHKYYLNIEIANFQQWLSEAENNSMDIIVFGDSIEHLYPDWAEDCIANAIRVSKKYIFISTTIGEFKQGAVFNNENEVHYLYWNKDPYEKLGFKVLWYDEISATAVYSYNKEKHKNGLIPLIKAKQIERGYSTFDLYGKLK